MLFAALNYFKYKRRLGMYSDEAIRSKGGRLANFENFANIDQYGPDYLFFYHGTDSLVSWLVMYFSSSIWSHTGTFTEHGNIIHATTGGIVEEPLSDYFDDKSYIAIKMLKEPLSPKEITKILEFLKSQIGCGFNWFGIWRLFFSIVLGANARYRVRFSADILLLLLFLSPLVLISLTYGFVLAAIGVIYLLIVFLNTRKRLKMRQLHQHTNL